MSFKPIEKDKRIDKVIEILRIGGHSERTVVNYSCAINRFLNYFNGKDISVLNEADILEYTKTNYLSKNCSTNTYNMNVSAIKFFYSINFNKTFNDKLLPHAKLTKKLPVTLDKQTFMKILSEEKFVKHKCWLLLGYCSGLRAEEITKLKIKDIYSSEHKLKVLGKRKKERFTFLADITIKYLRIYYKNYYLKYNHAKNSKDGYLFIGCKGAEHINSKSITNYFTTVKEKYHLDEDCTFHSLRHSFSTNFIKAGGDPFVLKSMLGHSSMSSTAIYVHMGRDFNNLKGVKYGNI